MTEEQYWDKDCTLVALYRKAEKLRRERLNQEYWLQGAYVYEALCRVSPIFHAFAKKGAKPKPYLPEPFALADGQPERRARDQAKKTFDKGKRFMEKFAIDTNLKFERK